MTRIVFLSGSTSCRNQMAAAFATLCCPDGVEILCAGLTCTPVHPLTVKVMAEVGIDMTGKPCPVLEDIGSQAVDVLISLCREASDECPFLPECPVSIPWAVAPPWRQSGSEDDQLAAFRQARDTIRMLVDDFFERGYFAAFRALRQHERLVLDRVSDGIIAHDLDGRIFSFNKAAETITGRAREDVMFKLCRDVFENGRCGGRCRVCADGGPNLEPSVDEVEVVRPDGERRMVQQTASPLTGTDGEPVGLLFTMHDITRERMLARRVGDIEQFSGIIGKDEQMLEVYDLIRDLSDTSMPVLIQGESGTGKELVAAALHNEGPRANRLFVPVNCGALPENLLESELFGHVKGSFTGAIRDKKGRFELADGGTIFLDEIGDISPAMQVKLLRVLQESTFERVGSEETLRVDVRVISATNKDIASEIAEGRFREDLFYRLSVVPIWLPPLRSRRADIPLLVEHFLEMGLKECGKRDITIAAETLDLMLAYDWPGNIRELQNWIRFALVRCRGREIMPEHLPPTFQQVVHPGRMPPPRTRGRRKLDAASVREALRASGGNKVEAAKRLHVSRATLYRFLERPPEPAPAGRGSSGG